MPTGEAQGQKNGTYSQLKGEGKEGDAASVNSLFARSKKNSLKTIRQKK